MQEEFSRVGTTHFDRVRPELAPEHIQLDERGLPELMAAFLKKAEEVPFRDTASWRSFFEFDPLFLLAEIIAFDVQEVVMDYEVLIRKLDYAHSDGEAWEYAKEDISEHAFRFFHLLDKWLRQSRFEHPFFHFDNISSLFVAFQAEFADHYEALCDVLGIDDPEISERWGVAQKEYAEWSEMDENGSPGQYLDRHFYKTIDTFRRLQARCQTLHDETLEEQPFHEPHVALAVSFLRLYQIVQKDINQFTEDFLNHFYRKMLGQSAHEAEGDEVYLTFRLGVHKQHYALTEGSLVSAGLDSDGRDILYSNEQEVVLTHARVVSLKSLLLLRDKNIEILDGSKYLFIAGLFKHSLGSSYSDGFGLNFGTTPVAAFGEPGRVSSTGQAVDESSEVGLYIESPYLLLREGSRSVSLVLICDLDSLQPLLEVLSPAAGDDGQTQGEDLSDNIVEDINIRFLKVFRDTLHIELSTAEGWLTVDNYEVLPPDNWANGEIRIYFELDGSQPAIDVLAEDSLPFDARWPVARVTLTRRRNIYAYTLLKDIRLREIRIDATVQGVKDLQLYNDIGQIDAGSPFFPFGPTPQKGNSMMIGYRELFLRRLESLTLTIDWQTLPELDKGFKAYYEGYGEPVENASFQVALAGLRNYRFEPDYNARQTIPLFAEDKGKLVDQTRMTDIDLQLLGLKPEFSMPDQLTFDNKAKTGFFRMELVSPTFGFGFKKYPKVFAQAVIQQAKQKKGEETVIPNEPYTPSIRNLTLDYQSTGSMILDSSRLRENDASAGHRVYHIHPFGVRKVFDGKVCDSDYLLPHYDDDGHLFLEIKDASAGQSLTLYFDLQETIQGATVDALPEIRWHYLHFDQWVAFEPKNVQDYTFQFTSSAVINLRLPEEISLDNTILPSGSFWIGAFAKGNITLLSGVRGVYSNVAKYHWIANAPGAAWKEHVPAKCINSFISSNTAIDGVHQPFRSFGGSPGEDDIHMRARVSERLRHKGRTSNAWDIELLLLQQFDYLHQVKVIRAQKEFGKEATPTTVVVVKRFETNGDLYRPTLNYKRLSDIASFLEAGSSSFARFRVVNPSYPTTKIRCKVRFVKDSEDGIHKLNRAINQFLCPWYYEEEQPFPLGRVFEFEDLKDALVSLDFVEFVTQLSYTILHTDAEGFSTLLDSAEMDYKEICERVAGWSVLFPAREHDIEPTTEDNYAPPRLSRIETLAIGEDFVITEEKEPSKSIGDGGDIGQYLIFNIKTEE